MSFAVLTVSTTLPRMPVFLGSSSSSYGISMPLSVLLIPPPARSKKAGSYPSSTSASLASLRRGKAEDGSHEMSSSSSSSANKKFLDGFDGRSVSCDGDGDKLPFLAQKLVPTECEVAASVTSGESVLYFRVVGSNFSIVLFSSMLVFELLRDKGRFLLDRFIITKSSSDEESESSSFCHDSSSSSSLTSTAMHCSTRSSNRMCRFSPLSGVCKPDVECEEAYECEVSVLIVLDVIVEKSDCARPIVGRFRRLGRSCCA
jgi:hypothetical protein